MGNNAISPYQQVIEKTKSLSFRSQVLTMNIEKKQAQSTRNEVRNTLYIQGAHKPPIPPIRLLEGQYELKAVQSSANDQLR